MRIIFVICILYLFNFSLIKCNYDEENEETTVDDNPTPTNTEKGNVPEVKSTSSNIYLHEQFQDKRTWGHWVKSQAKKDDVEESLAKYDGQWDFKVPESSVYNDDYGLILNSKARHHAISVNLKKPFDFSTSPLVVQYEVKFQTNQECGGAYVKLLSKDGNDLDLEQVTDKTPYSIMFGPDMCGADHKYHFIVRYRNPKTGAYTEHQAKKPTESLDTYFTDKKSHLYTLVVTADNSFKMYIDNKLINSGSLLEDMEPSITPSKEIVDETDRKPDDWDDTEQIPDTQARKPKDWDETAPREIVDKSAAMPDDWLEDEPAMIPDPDAVKPEDWDDEIDGAWEAPSIDNPVCQSASGCGKWTQPTIPNPAYRGPWSAPLIDNRNYQGVWEPRKIPNPDYFDEVHPYKLASIGSLALELWSMVDGVVFDNFIITSDQSIAKKYADQIWYPKSVLEAKETSSSTPSSSTSSSDSFIDTILNATKEQPWLWALASIGLLFPLILIYGCRRLFRSSSKKTINKLKKKKDDIKQNVSKKTNVTDDDDEGEVEEIDIDEEQTEDTAESKTSGKDALENDEEKPSPKASSKARRRARKE